MAVEATKLKGLRAEPAVRPARADASDLRSQENALRLIDKYAPGAELLKPGSDNRLHGRCPFPGHDDKRPSFALCHDGAYICSCGDGDILRLLVELKGESWRDEDLPKYEGEARDALGLSQRTGNAQARAALRHLSNGDEPADEPQANAEDLGTPRVRHRGAIDGARWILDAPEGVPAVWGCDDEVLWSEGEPLMLVGPSGVGKTTIAQRLALARAGIGPTELLGLPVARGQRRVLYIAADRPAQAQRSFARMVGESHRQALIDRLVIWAGPLPFDLAAKPAALHEFAVEHGAGTVVIDSLKDVALDLSKDETGARVNHALQHVVANGIEVAANHHQRKASAGNPKPKSLADVYGSTWLTAGTGSVVLIWGEAGDLVVELRHLKQPVTQIGPFKILHDHERGWPTLHEEIDPLAYLRASGEAGVTVQELARHAFDTDSPSANDIERARRRLNKLVESEYAAKRDGSPATYVATAKRGSRKGSRA